LSETETTFIRGSSLPWTQLEPGIRRQILGHGPDLMMVTVEFAKGAIGKLHQHPHRQVTYVAKGSFRVTVDGRDETLREGDCFYVAADLVHGVEALDEGTLIDVFTPAREDFLSA
jgi:quercetin dioxygenase-like cupin family protein